MDVGFKLIKKEFYFCRQAESLGSGQKLNK
jgi:hypothetical protein